MNPRYLIISPVRDEERFVERTLESVFGQTISPVKWVIVDDGSVDRTTEILARHKGRVPWLSVIRRERGGGRQAGTGVIAAFNEGLASIGNLDFDFIVKLDCDLILRPDYFERLFQRFDAQPRLGIASGVYLEETSQGWIPVEMPDYHAAGASKVLRRECFDQIGGFVTMRGWDTVDEIRAMALNWKTCHYPELQFHHLKPEGSGSGWQRTQMLHGEVYYRTGGGILFFC